MEGDYFGPIGVGVGENFYPRPPGGGRPSPTSPETAVQKFLSTPSGWRATTFRATQGPRTPISIHALRVEGDCACRRDHHQRRRFLSTPSGWRATSPTSPETAVQKFLSTPSGWRATSRPVSRHPLIGFLSTPSGWRATASCEKLFISTTYFYPRPPGGGRPAVALDTTLTHEGISIHALRVEGDTQGPRTPETARAISIHALRVEGDPD